MSKTTMALAMAAILAATTAAQAGSRDDPDRVGGFRIGPLDQIMGGPSTWRGRVPPPSVYAFVPGSRLNGVYAYSPGRRLNGVYGYSPGSRLNRVWYYSDDDD